MAIRIKVEKVDGGAKPTESFNKTTFFQNLPVEVIIDDSLSTGLTTEYILKLIWLMRQGTMDVGISGLLPGDSMIVCIAQAWNEQT